MRTADLDMILSFLEVLWSWLLVSIAVMKGMQACRHAGRQADIISRSYKGSTHNTMETLAY
jgi:hypothetical protein